MWSINQVNGAGPSQSSPRLSFVIASQPLTVLAIDFSWQFLPWIRRARLAAKLINLSFPAQKKINLTTCLLATVVIKIDGDGTASQRGTGWKRPTAPPLWWATYVPRLGAIVNARGQWYHHINFWRTVVGVLINNWIPCCTCLGCSGLPLFSSKGERRIPTYDQFQTYDIGLAITLWLFVMICMHASTTLCCVDFYSQLSAKKWCFCVLQKVCETKHY